MIIKILQDMYFSKKFLKQFLRSLVNPLTTGVENECWLRELYNFEPGQKWVLTTGIVRFWTWTKMSVDYGDCSFLNIIWNKIQSSLEF